MIFRSSTKIEAQIGLGKALRLLSRNDLTLLNTSSDIHLDFKDEREQGWFFLLGSWNEIRVLLTMYQLTGPAVPAEMLSTIPLHFTELRNRARNRRAFRQGVMHALRLNGIEIPTEEPHAFGRWLSALDTVPASRTVN
jgi:hypothetical protein